MATQTVTFGNGCFWCTEAIFQQLKGVSQVVSGYTGGQTEDPTYKEVCTGSTGHAEVIQITYDDENISFEELLSAFFQTHDPTTLNRQGADIGTQYRSAVFYHDESQKAQAEQMIQRLDSEQVFANPIVTEVTQFETFYPAEDYHQNFFNENQRHPYCANVIGPKVDKFLKSRPS